MWPQTARSQVALPRYLAFVVGELLQSGRLTVWMRRAWLKWATYHDVPAVIAASVKHSVFLCWLDFLSRSTHHAPVLASSGRTTSPSQQHPCCVAIHSRPSHRPLRHARGFTLVKRFTVSSNVERAHKVSVHSRCLCFSRICSGCLQRSRSSMAIGPSSWRTATNRNWKRCLRGEICTTNHPQSPAFAPAPPPTSTI